MFIKKTGYNNGVYRQISNRPAGFQGASHGGAYYVDKTQYIKKIVDSRSQYYFLARPRRFGKSLFLSTLRYFFEGERELYKGLYIDSTYWDWKKYPVLYLDLNNGDYTDPKGLDRLLNKNLRRWEAAYGVERSAEDSLVERFETVIEAACEKTDCRL